jgi:cobalt/nickel transport system permease protein
MLALDTAAYTSPWRHRHPGEKALLALGLLGCAVTLPPWPAAPVVGTVALVCLLGPAGLRVSILARAARAPLLFVATGSLPLLVTVGGGHLVSWNPSGLGAAAQLTARALAALLCLLLFAATTPLADVLPRLTRLGVPSAVTEVAALTYRMLFLLMDTARSVREAQAARLGYRTWRSAQRSLAGQGGAIFVRAFDRARRMEEGLALRGYDGSLRVAVENRDASPLFIALSLLLLAAIVGGTHLTRSVL